VGNMSLAVNRRFKNKQGEWDDDVTYVTAVIWGEYAQRWQPRLKKGTPVIVQGTLRSNKWETKDGQKRSSLEIVVNKIQTLERTAAPGAVSESAVSDDDAPAPSASSDEVPF
ncbi:MAG: single-stranded DNA-binding protein, partial [Endomicrobiia bacterium]|nr:single-stranded DNA-binding protein [Endomicrobiia bacterium]